MIQPDKLVKDLDTILADPPVDTLWRVAVLEAGDTKRTPLYTSGPRVKTFGAGNMANLLVAEAGQQAGLGRNESIQITEEDLVRHNWARSSVEPAPQGRGPETVAYSTALTRLLGEGDAITQRALVRTLGGPGAVNQLVNESPIGSDLKFSGLSPHTYNDDSPNASYGPGQTVPYETALLFNHLVTACDPMYRAALSANTSNTDGLLRVVSQSDTAAPHLEASYRSDRLSVAELGGLVVAAHCEDRFLPPGLPEVPPSILDMQARIGEIVLHVQAAPTVV